MSDAVLLLAHGAPERLDDVAEYLRYVRGGRPTAPALIEEIRRRYAAISGRSPLLARTREQAEALGRRLASAARVYFGMRNWHPFIGETLRRMQADGIRRIVAICLAPQYSKLSVGRYIGQAREALAELGYAPEVIWTESFHSHPLLIEAFAEKLGPLLCGQRRVLFTAHSLPERVLAEGDPYDRETRVTAAAVAARLNLTAWDFAYQSQGATEERWLGPTVEARLDEYAAAGVREVALAPVGFVSDHVEVLYDVDIQFRQYALERGIELFRAESLNASPAFISVLVEIAASALAAASPKQLAV